MSCPCGVGASYEACCAPLHKGEKQALRAEQLMRARYSAFVKGEIDFILATHEQDSREENDRETLETWSRESDWLGLEVVASEDGLEDDESGVVEFKARFKVDGKEQTHHERALFNKRQGQWFFSDGTMVIAPVRREGSKIGRNEPCPCGSGKKHKKCCLAKVS